MTPDDIRNLTRAQPFIPFRLTLSNGEEFDIQHPDMIMPISFGSAMIARPVPQWSDAPRQQAIQVSLMHIVKTEPLGVSSPPPLSKSTV